MSHPMVGPVQFNAVSQNKKLSPMRYDLSSSGRWRPVPTGPKVSSTYVSIDGTCRDCRFQNNGCYVQTGFTGHLSKRLDAGAASLRDVFSGVGAVTLKVKRRVATEIIRQEVVAIRKAFKGGPIPQDGGRDGKSGRDLRYHVGGDVGTPVGAVLLREEAADWRRRGGGDVWIYTHAWRRIKRSVWGGRAGSRPAALAVLASVETVADFAHAVRRGYVPAITLQTFPSERAFRVVGLPRGWRILPCPAQTRGRTCVECRACFDTDGLWDRKLAIGFAFHGQGGEQRKKRILPVLHDGPGIELEKHGPPPMPRVTFTRSGRFARGMREVQLALFTDDFVGGHVKLRSGWRASWAMDRKTRHVAITAPASQLPALEREQIVRLVQVHVAKIERKQQAA